LMSLPLKPQHTDGFKLVESSEYEGVSKSFRTGRLEREPHADGTAFCHLVQLYRYFVSQSSEFCRHSPMCCFSTSVYCCKRLFRYRLSPETFGYTLVLLKECKPAGSFSCSLSSVCLTTQIGK
jgi:hypothetical protein